MRVSDREEDQPSGVGRSVRPSPLPDLTRPDVGAVLVSQWTVDAPDRQRAVAEEIMAGWERVSWPEALLSVSCFLSTDGEVVLTYAQWASDEASREFARSRRAAQNGRSGNSIPALEQGPVEYRLYRSGVREGAPKPGCVVIVSVEFDGPDERRQQRWIDTVFEAMGAETEPPRGGISGHFHTSLDGIRVLNYAEWTDEEAHREAIERSRQGAVGSGPKWREVQTFPGLVSGRFKRYHFYRGLSGTPLT